MHDTAFAITADAGDFGAQALALARSVRTQYPDAEIVVFVPESGAAEMADALLADLRAVATVEVGPAPDPDYPITAQLRAFELAAERPVDRVVMLDTDVLLLDELRVPDSDAALLARPCTLRGSFWTNDVSTDVWAALYERYDLPEPIEPVSAVLGGELPYPFYNSAVVVARDTSLPARLLERTLDVRDAAREMVAEAAGSATPMFYSDQIALSLLAQEVSFDVLPLENNYPVPAFLRVPSSVAGLHYGNRAFLGTALPDEAWADYADLLDLDPSLSDWGRRVASWTWFRVANRLSYASQTRIRRVANSRHAP